MQKRGNDGHKKEASMARLALAQIERDPTIQQRAKGLNRAVVQDYKAAMLRGEGFPPVVVFHDRTHYWLADGFHRCAAAEEADVKELDVEIQQGTQRDAQLYAAGANTMHGLRRTNADKRMAVLTLLQDPEWAQWSDHEIARRTLTTHPLVAKLRRELSRAPSAAGEGEHQGRKASADGALTGLRRAWKKADDEQREQWVAECRDELLAYLHAA